MSNLKRDVLADVSIEYVQKLQYLQQFSVQFATIDDINTLTESIVAAVRELVPVECAVLLWQDSAKSFLCPTGSQKEICIDLAAPEAHPFLQHWHSGDALTFHRDEFPILETAFHRLNADRVHTIPLRVQDHLAGVLMLKVAPGQVLSQDDQEILQRFAANSAICLYNKHNQAKTVAELADNVRKITMLTQLDHELTETMSLSTVFTMVLDWALRFTNAHYASIALYDPATGTLRDATNYGYPVKDEKLDSLRNQTLTTITHRAACAGESITVDDTSAPPPAIVGWRLDNVRSQLAVPVVREEQIVAVITLESRNIAAFNDEHIHFVKQLATRAGVAVDNARLYNETKRERDKLSHIVSNIGDAVIVINTNGRIVLMSQSAYSALQHYTEDCTDQPILEAIKFPPLLDIYARALKSVEIQDEELTFPNERTYYVRSVPDSNVGCIIIMQDITPYKETDRLKNELIATVSHDLKQPLGVMHGYLDLLRLKTPADETIKGYIQRINDSIENMRRLIDDVLDLARLESGMKLQMAPFPLSPILRWCIESNRPAAERKAMRIESEFPPHLPVIRGEKARLEQVFNNLIGNAIKYTPGNGWVRVKVEDRGAEVRVAIQDNGIGISPEDQPLIFDRFYRVRRPETQLIEGTGLGLAIVKTLIEAHNGKIRVDSRLGEGSTFHVILPTYRV